MNIGDKVRIKTNKFTSKGANIGSIGIVDNIVELDQCIVYNQDWQGASEYGSGRISIKDNDLELYKEI